MIQTIYQYAISYAYSTETGIGFGMCEVGFSNMISRMSDIQDVCGMIRVSLELSSVKDVVPLSIYLLRIREMDVHGPYNEGPIMEEPRNPWDDSSHN